MTTPHMHYFTIEQREKLQASLQALRERLGGELRAADTALARLHEPEFGLCEGCGAEIPFARLSANPVATRCVACQKLDEGA